MWTDSDSGGGADATVRRVQLRRRVTITDVARAAGVSVATVSKVINDRYGVAATTSAKVHTVIDELGFESSLVARSLRSSRTNVIGILVADFEPFSTELLKGAARGIRGTGYELVAYSAGGAEDEVGWERRYMSRLSGTLVDGAVLVTPTDVTTEYGTPVVAVDPHLNVTGMPTVDSDSFRGAIAATEHLLELGHRRIAFLGGRQDLESAQLREQGYRSAHQSAGVAVDPELVRIGGYRPELAEEPARALLTLPDRPTAVFAANDVMAMRTIRVAERLGLAVPDDVSVVGFDDVPEAMLVAPQLTTIAQPIQEMGFTAVRLLLDLLAGRPLASTHVTLPTALVVRHSTGPVTVRECV